MRADDPNLPILIVIVQALGDLKDEMVFVGGCAAGLLLTDPAVDHIRATNDVDAIVEVAALNDFYVAESRLEARGFVRNMPSELICRWEHRASGVLFDMMPVDPGVLGFANRWYPEAVQTATRQQIAPELDIRLISAPAFIATKLEAFVSRGQRDHLTSHDLEDVLSVVDGRASLAQEMQAASPAMQAAVRQELARLLGTPDFIARLPGLIADADRTPVVLERLRALAPTQQL
jgi:predicted nucleotidyltransferase